MASFMIQHNANSLHNAEKHKSTSQRAQEAVRRSLGQTYDCLVRTLACSIYHGNTLFLFTRNDLFAVGIPSIAFAAINSIAVGTYDIKSTGIVSPLSVAACCLWFWVHILIVDIGNQTLPDSVAEDAINKPWRPMPSHRLTNEQATVLRWIMYPVGPLLSVWLGGLPASLVLLVLNYMYNHRGGSDHPFFKGFLSAAGVLTLAAGSFEVMMAQQGLLIIAGSKFWTWLLIILVIMSLTINVSDMYDQAGDGLRGRRTLPLVVGDTIARWTIAVPFVFGSLFCAAYWNLSSRNSIALLAFGLHLASRTLTKTTAQDDKKTYKLWSLWMISLFLLPLARVN